MMRTIPGIRFVMTVLCASPLAVAGPGDGADGGYYTEERIYQSRPEPDREMNFECIGATGIKARIYRGVAVTVEGAEPASPAAGKFAKGQVILAVNGQALKGRNPFVLLGNALTAAEASDGRMVFEVQEAKSTSTRKIALEIPVLGSYGGTWPLKCGKSRKIIEQAARFYSDKEAFNQGGVPGALGMLFLLSTGEDRYLPRVKEYFAGMVANPKGIGEHTWDNGYNGIAACEYYLRTGDKTMLPVLQHFCDDARERQMFGCSWTHWGRGISPGYVAGGLMNPAGSQVLTTLLLAKECGVNVDDATLLGALRYWYRFAGHGTVPYGDHRPEGGLGSNGKDGMAAAAMQVAAGAQGDTTAYKLANRHLGMSTITSYPGLAVGHGDEGRGDGIWRGIASSYMIHHDPQAYFAAMRRLQWWYDLSRRPSGALGIATCQGGFDDAGSGAGVAMSYTAPLKTLRITGAPRSKFAKDFTLPENIWGRPADRVFLSAEHNPMYKKYGADEPIHIPFYRFGSGYTQPSVDLKTVSRDEMLKNIGHKNYMIRCQAAKALRIVGAFEDLEKLLQDDDPRVRRAALDGMIDYNYWFGMGNQPIRTEEMTPGMIRAIGKMLADPQEALYVIDGALMAMKQAPAKEIESALPLITPWTTHDDWWLREAAFAALAGLEKDDAMLLKVLPTMLDMMVKEYHTMPRGKMVDQVNGILQRKTQDSEIGRMIKATHRRAVRESEIKPGDYAAEGAYNVSLSTDFCLRQVPEFALEIAKVMKSRFDLLETAQIIALVGTPNSIPGSTPYGLYSVLEKQSPEEKQSLTALLCNDYRQELVRRLAGDKDNLPLIDTIIDLTKLTNPNAGWQPIGTPAPAGRAWRFACFDPRNEKDQLHQRERRRFRGIALPTGMDDWYNPEFDDSKWQSGKAPIGKGEFKNGAAGFANQSEWGPEEFLVMRTTFEMDEPDYDTYRIRVLACNGYHIYLNGKMILGYGWWQDQPVYVPIRLGENESRLLKKGKNVLAVYANTEYPNAWNTNDKCKERAQIDCFIEGLRRKDLGL